MGHRVPRDRRELRFRRQFDWFDHLATVR
jgi:hypothetical protein